MKCSFLLVQRLVDLSATVLSALSDPRIRTLQDGRIHNDVKRLFSHDTSSQAVRITSPMFPSKFPSLKKWTMVAFDESIITVLYIEHFAFLDDEKWHSIL